MHEIAVPHPVRPDNALGDDVDARFCPLGEQDQQSLWAQQRIVVIGEKPDKLMSSPTGRRGRSLRASARSTLPWP
jgi:hypothetical protein